MSLIKSRLMLMPMPLICGILLAVIALSQGAYAGAECASLGGACDDGGWSGAAKLDEIGEPTTGQEQVSSKWPAKSRELRWNMSASTETTKTTEIEPAEDETADDDGAGDTGNSASKKPAQGPMNIVRSDEAKAIIAPLEETEDSDILLDVSENSSSHIQGSVVIPYMQFNVEAGILKTVPEMSQILGDAGISRTDSVIIYGECLPCGGGPSVATYVYWMMKGLGHERVRVLDGTAEDWAASKNAITKEASILPSKVYAPAETTNYTATYDFVKSGQAQIVDARTVQEYGAGSIPGSISIPYASVLSGKRIKDENQLNKVFMMLDKDKPVVVFTNTGMKASVVWFALKMNGYDARLYNYRDWAANEEKRIDTAD